MNINRHGIPVLIPHRRGRLKQCFKLRHATRDEAFDHLVRVEVLTGDMSLSVYRCRHCGTFHIGHAGEDKR